MKKSSPLVICILVFWAGNILAQGVSEIQIARVFRASSLSGVVKFGEGEGVPGALVEECTSNWVKPVASTRTDENGNFKLPTVNRGSIHYLRISREGANTLLVKVKITPRASGLVLSLQPST